MAGKWAIKGKKQPVLFQEGGAFKKSLPFQKKKKRAPKTQTKVLGVEKGCPRVRGLGLKESSVGKPNGVAMGIRKKRTQGKMQMGGRDEQKKL